MNPGRVKPIQLFMARYTRFLYLPDEVTEETPLFFHKKEDGKLFPLNQKCFGRSPTIAVMKELMTAAPRPIRISLRMRGTMNTATALPIEIF